ncbi:orotidine-5'-phosphate decarboxylase [Candidatus Bathyarchaeota archaeon]|nr:MAG: orotidine-5'-phosphate decarboxylase [Candidatus Bathyarchaeota archaeon]
MGFRELMLRARDEKSSPIVLALDLPPDRPSKLMRKANRVLEAASPFVCALKLNFHLILPLGLSGVKPILDRAHDLGLACIADPKLSDIGSTNEVAARYYFEAGFDALTASPLVGWEGGLEPIFKLAREAGRGVLVLAYMSHPGASEFFGLQLADGRPFYELAVRKALEWGADGLVVGATRPEVIKAVRELAGRDVLIFAPGVGVQGGDARAALEAGADFLIVGRSIVLAEDPGEAARAVLKALS